MGPKVHLKTTGHLITCSSIISKYASYKISVGGIEKLGYYILRSGKDIASM